MKLIKRKKIKQLENQVEYFDITTLVSNWDSEIMPSLKNSHYKTQKNAKELGYPYQSTLDDFIKYTNANNKTNFRMSQEWLKIKEDFIIKIKEIVERAGAGFALPSNSIYVEQVEHNLKKRELPKELMDTLYKDEKSERNVVDVMDGDF